MAEKLENGRFADVVALAEQNYEQEQTQRTTLSKFDLPKREPLIYLRLFPRTYDETIATSLHASSMLASVLESKYPKMHRLPTIFSDYPKDDLKRVITEEYEKGVRYFCLDIYSHGSEEKLDFADGLSAADLAEIVKRFPQARFQISTIACYGGGLRKGFLSEFDLDKSLKSNLSVFLQSKPKATNPVARIESLLPNKSVEDAKDVSTYYHLFLL